MTNFSDLRVSTASNFAGTPCRETSLRAPKRGGPLVAIAAALLLAACSTAPDWTKPSTISDAITGASPSEPTNETVAAQQAQAEANSDAASFPSAGTVPGVPETGDYAAKQDLANSLVADRQHARYSGEALRGGTEPPASPLPSRRAAPLPELPEVAAAAETATTVDGAGVIPERGIPAYKAPTRRMGDPEAGREVAEQVTEEAADEVASAAASNDVEVATLPAPAAPAEPAPAPAPAAAVPAAPAPAPVAAAPAPVESVTPTAARVATTAPARRPAVPARSVPTYVAEADAARELDASRPASAAVAAPAATRAPVAAASGELQFAASTAPPLPAEVMDQVPAVVSARFEETRGGSAPVVAAPADTVPAQANAVSDGVVIDYSAIGAGSPVPDLEQGSTSILPTSAYEPLNISGAEGGPFTPVALYFGHGSSRLSADDKAQIAEVAALQSKRGGGIVRVVGHASSRTTNLPVESHLMANFEMSMSRANAVAAELMRQGVAPADMVIEAVGDRAPVFYESMPAGEAGNRRAEIFLE